MDTLRIGTLGAARITPVALLKPAEKNARVTVTAVAARDRERAERFASKRGIPRVLESYDALVTDPDIDAVYIPLPNSHHAEWTLAALEAGKHVLCEKPFTANADEARVIQHVADQHPELVVMEAFHWRYHPLARAVIALLRDGEIGALERVEVTMAIPLVMRNDIRWQLELAGGTMMDVGCYTVSMLRHFAREEPTVTHASVLEKSAGVDRRVDADFDFPSGATGKITASMLSRTVLWIGARITGADGSVRIVNPVAPQYFHRCTVRTDSGSRRLSFPRSETSYGNQLEAFAAAVLDSAPVLTPPADSVANMQVIDDVYAAAGMAPRPARI